ncbi:Hypothetical predicted protein, partial [Paramuricea clavata]
RRKCRKLGKAGSRAIGRSRRKNLNKFIADLVLREKAQQQEEENELAFLTRQEQLAFERKQFEQKLEFETKMSEIKETSMTSSPENSTSAVWDPTISSYGNADPTGLERKRTDETDESKAETKLTREVFALAATGNDTSVDLLGKFELWKTLRIGAWVARFVSNAKVHDREKTVGPITSEEIQKQLAFWVKRVQGRNEATNTFHDDRLRLNLQRNNDSVYECRGRLQGQYPTYLPDQDVSIEVKDVTEQLTSMCEVAAIDSINVDECGVDSSKLLLQDEIRALKDSLAISKFALSDLNTKVKELENEKACLTTSLISNAPMSIILTNKKWLPQQTITVHMSNIPWLLSSPTLARTMKLFLFPMTRLNLVKKNKARKSARGKKTPQNLDTDENEKAQSLPRVSTENSRQSDNSSPRRKKVAAVIGDSIIKNVQGWRLSDSNNHVVMKSFGGANISDMEDYCI